MTEPLVRKEFEVKPFAPPTYAPPTYATPTYASPTLQPLNLVDEMQQGTALEIQKHMESAHSRAAKKLRTPPIANRQILGPS
jgi:hypothetical protein